MSTTTATTNKANSPPAVSVSAVTHDLYKMCPYLQKLDDQSEEKSVLEKYSLDKLQDFQIFKTNPKFYARLKMVTDGENFYEAQQMYKTINFRCMNNNLIEESLILLFNGIVYFLNRNSFHCGFDLSKAFVETLKASNIKSLEDDLRKKIKIIHSLLRTNGEERNEFSLAILKWSGNLFQKSKMETKNLQSVYNNYQKTFGHFLLHQDFAINLWKEKNYIQARYHFLHSLDAQSFAHMMVECCLNFGYPSEYDLFLAQSVLQYLSLRNLPAGEEFFYHYVRVHPSVKKTKLLGGQNTKEVDCYDSPLINFINFLLQALKNFDYKIYQSLIEHYKISLQRDTSLNVYLERIAEYYFNKKRFNQTDGLFSNLMRMLTSNEASGGGETTNDNIANNNSSLNHADNASDDDWDTYRDLDEADTLD